MEVCSLGRGKSGVLGHGGTHDEPEPRVIRGLSAQDVQQVACGDAHSMALTRVGVVYTWGSGLMGALGHGTRDDELAPRRIDRLGTYGLAIAQIAAGKFSSAALSGRGVVYAWGWDGCETTPCDKAPVEQRDLAPLGPISQIAAGSHHLAALHARGVCTWGGDQQLQTRLLTDHGVLQLACGAHHTAVRAADGAIFSWQSTRFDMDARSRRAHDAPPARGSHSLSALHAPVVHSALAGARTIACAGQTIVALAPGGRGALRLDSLLAPGREVSEASLGSDVVALVGGPVHVFAVSRGGEATYAAPTAGDGLRVGRDAAGSHGTPSAAHGGVRWRFGQRLALGAPVLACAASEWHTLVLTDVAGAQLPHGARAAPQRDACAPHARAGAQLAHVCEAQGGWASTSCADVATCARADARTTAGGALGAHYEQHVRGEAAGWGARVDVPLAAQVQPHGARALSPTSVAPPLAPPWEQLVGVAGMGAAAPAPALQGLGASAGPPLLPVGLACYGGARGGVPPLPPRRMAWAESVGGRQHAAAPQHTPHDEYAQCASARCAGGAAAPPREGADCVWPPSCASAGAPARDFASDAGVSGAAYGAHAGGSQSDWRDAADGRAGAAPPPRRGDGGGSARHASGGAPSASSAAHNPPLLAEAVAEQLSRVYSRSEALEREWREAHATLGSDLAASLARIEATVVEAMHTSRRRSGERGARSRTRSPASPAWPSSDDEGEGERDAERQAAARRQPTTGAAGLAMARVDGRFGHDDEGAREQYDDGWCDDASDAQSERAAEHAHEARSRAAQPRAGARGAGCVRGLGGALSFHPTPPQTQPPPPPPFTGVARTRAAHAAATVEAILRSPPSRASTPPLRASRSPPRRHGPAALAQSRGTRRAKGGRAHTDGARVPLAGGSAAERARAVRALRAWHARTPAGGGADRRAHRAAASAFRVERALGRWDVRTRTARAIAELSACGAGHWHARALSVVMAMLLSHAERAARRASLAHRADREGPWAPRARAVLGGTLRAWRDERDSWRAQRDAARHRLGVVRPPAPRAHARVPPPPPALLAERGARRAAPPLRPPRSAAVSARFALVTDTPPSARARGDLRRAGASPRAPGSAGSAAAGGGGFGTPPRASPRRGLVASGSRLAELAKPKAPRVASRGPAAYARTSQAASGAWAGAARGTFASPSPPHKAVVPRVALACRRGEQPPLVGSAAAGVTGAAMVRFAQPRAYGCGEGIGERSVRAPSPGGAHAHALAGHASRRASIVPRARRADVPPAQAERASEARATPTRAMPAPASRAVPRPGLTQRQGEGRASTGAQRPAAATPVWTPHVPSRGSAREQAAGPLEHGARRPLRALSPSASQRPHAPSPPLTPPLPHAHVRAGIHAVSADGGTRAAKGGKDRMIVEGSPRGGLARALDRRTPVAQQQARAPRPAMRRPPLPLPAAGAPAVGAAHGHGHAPSADPRARGAHSPASTAGAHAPASALKPEACTAAGRRGASARDPSTPRAPLPTDGRLRSSPAATPRAMGGLAAGARGPQSWEAATPRAMGGLAAGARGPQSWEAATPRAMGGLAAGARGPQSWEAATAARPADGAAPRRHTPDVQSTRAEPVGAGGVPYAVLHCASAAERYAQLLDGAVPLLTESAPPGHAEGAPHTPAAASAAARALAAAERARQAYAIAATALSAAAASGEPSPGAACMSLSYAAPPRLGAHVGASAVAKFARAACAPAGSGRVSNPASPALTARVGSAHNTPACSPAPRGSGYATSPGSPARPSTPSRRKDTFVTFGSAR
ncbi:hypothetical protein KFE25_000039 [Diacronema lutheri]|uniref:Uncharacterized protein n=1 Tax=Diacronema lutheri TaxID=2081491 RepID=A0A8J5X8Y5_DIALT|nr:hypothetical protein KFE25_000039 [Diacronema lutheri]